MKNSYWLCVAVVGFIFGASLARAFPRVVGYTSVIGPANSTSRVEIAAGATGVRNCLTHASAVSTSTFTFRVLDGGTTVYAIQLAANSGFVGDWNPEDPICSTAATILTLSVDSPPYQINYQGYKY